MKGRPCGGGGLKEDFIPDLSFGGDERRGWRDGRVGSGRVGTGRGVQFPDSNGVKMMPAPRNSPVSAC